MPAEGSAFMLGTVAAAVLLFAAALRVRSWTLWLLAFATTIAALCMAWSLRELRTA